MFRLFWPTTFGPGPHQQECSILFNFSLNLGYNHSFEPLVRYVALLVEKFWTKNKTPFDYRINCFHRP